MLGAYWEYEELIMGPLRAHPCAHDGPMFGPLMDPFGAPTGPIFGSIMGQAMVVEETLNVILGRW